MESNRLSGSLVIILQLQCTHQGAKAAMLIFLQILPGMIIVIFPLKCRLLLC